MFCTVIVHTMYPNNQSPECPMIVPFQWSFSTKSNGLVPSSTVVLQRLMTAAGLAGREAPQSDGISGAALRNAPGDAGCGVRLALVVVVY